MQVRRIHSASHKSASDAKVLLMTSQYDMILTHWAFVAPPLLFKKELGISCSAKDEEGFIHFWRVAGFLLGIEDR